MPRATKGSIDGPFDRIDTTVGCVRCVIAYGAGCEGSYIKDFCNGTAADRRAIGECQDSPDWNHVRAGHGRYCH